MELTNCSAALEQGCSEPGADSEQISEEFSTRLLPQSVVISA